ncbi:ribonuclease HII [Paenibacillus naphthalenovorans]|uniref:Ribonuclease HII n=1 Tax=Paenibacillus naphthalenovorans TaxID=162209 RepID=A0A0U2W579_9BACL|nr:ribonuclease HII [Paenibacillus naphthalenovorans]ALS21614.1 ribonuclease HII [Paenibacillus naphthalenovorans]
MPGLGIGKIHRVRYNVTSWQNVQQLQVKRMLEYERELWEQGKLYIAGVDEVGRGCLFGDVVAAAVILPQGLVLEDVNDSKQISEKKREALYEIIMEKALAVGVGIVDVATIERINIKQAARLAMKEAVEKLNLTPDMLLVDAEKVDVPIEQLAIIHGDARSQSIAAASIIAKVTRDRMCFQWDVEYPEYGIAIHKGYATKKHREAIQEYGPSPMHRKTFLKKIVYEQQLLF